MAPAWHHNLTYPAFTGLVANSAQLHGGELQPGRRRQTPAAPCEGGGGSGGGGGAQDVDVLGVRHLAGEHGHDVADVTQTVNLILNCSFCGWQCERREILAWQLSR